MHSILRKSNTVWQFHFIYKPLIKFPVEFGYMERDVPFCHKVLRIIKKLLSEFFLSFNYREKDYVVLKGKVVFIALTNNQYYTIKEVHENLANSIVFSPKLYSDILPHHHTHRLFINRLTFLRELIPQNFYLRRMLKEHYKELFTIGYYNVGFISAYRNVLQKNRPQAIVFTNDVHPHLRSIVKAADDLGIPTIYIQHCTASQIFPMIEYDYALLEGRHSIEKYNISKSTVVKLIGMPKFDKYALQINENEVIKTIGIAINAQDNDEGKILKLFQELQKINDIKIIFRPHQALFPFKSKYSWNEFSDPFKEESFAFLRKIDLLIAGNSSIHQEAALLNITCFHINLAVNNYGDYFDFIKNEISLKVEVADIFKKIEDMKSKRYFPLPKMKFYNDVIDSPSYGKSAVLAAEYIDQVVNV